MKRLFTLFVISALVTSAHAQTSFSDDFESYAEGDYIGVESPVWTTWSGTTGGSEDAQVVTSQALSGTNSAYFSSTSTNGGPQDVILPFGTQHTSGLFTFNMAMRIASGKNAYFNFQANPTPGQIWALDMNAELGNIEFSEGGVPKTAGTYPPDEWFEMSIEANLSFNIWKVFIDGDLVGTFSSGANKLASADFYPIQGSSFWIDDVSFDWEEIITPNVNLSAVSVSGIGVLSGILYSPVAKVRNNGQENITSFDIEFAHAGGTTSESVTGVNIAPGAYYEVEFDAGFVPEVGAQTMVVTLSSVNGMETDDYPEDDVYTYNTNLIAAAEGKHAVVEEGTGTWCQYCPRGAVTMARMTKTYGKSYVGIAVHNGDPMADPTYDSGLGLTAFPTGRVDRGPQISDSNFESNWIQRMQVAPKGLVEVAAQYNEETRLVEAVVSVEMLETVTGNYRLGLVVIEDSVTGTGPGWSQSNAFSGMDIEMGGYENLPSWVPASLMVYDHVARSIMPNYSGATGIFPNELTQGETYSINFNFTMPEVWDADKIELAGLFYGSNNRIDNAYRLSLAEATENEWFESGNVIVGVTALSEPDAEIKLYPNPSTGTSFVDINLRQAEKVSVDVVSIDGRVVASRDYGVINSAARLPINTQNFAKGMYLVQIKVGEARKVMKLMVD